MQLLWLPHGKGLRLPGHLTHDYRLVLVQQYPVATVSEVGVDGSMVWAFKLQYPETRQLRLVWIPGRRRGNGLFKLTASRLAITF